MYRAFVDKEIFPDEMAYERAFVDAMNKWRGEYEIYATHISKGVRTKYVHQARLGLEILRSQSCPGIPERFSRYWIRPGSPDHSLTPSLGVADWPELDGLSFHQRERRALELVRAGFIKLFFEHERIHLFGQRLLSGEEISPQSDPQACKMLLEGLLHYRNAVRNTGTFKLDREVVKALPKDPELWRQAAGENIVDGDSAADAFWAFRAAFGPTPRAMIGAFGVLICDTGWNLQPARDLSRNPYVFRSATDVYVAENSFIDSFKNRAGHNVVAYLGDRGALDERRSSIASEAWQQTINGIDRLKKDDGYSRLKRYGDSKDEVTAAQILDRYSRMAETMRIEFGRHSDRLFGDALWIFSNRTHEPRTYKSDTWGLYNIYPENSVMSRHGFQLKSIRRTFLIIKMDETKSFGATKAVASHSNSSVLLPHYLNSPAVCAELDQNVREFQNAIESIVTQDLDQANTSILLGKSITELQRMRRLADRAGITAALGFSPGAEIGNAVINEAGVLRFEPSADRLTELYLVHLKLRNMQAHYPNRARFRRDFLPLLAWTKAVGRELFRRHLGPRYWRAARTASVQLRNGQIALPVID